MNKSLSGGADLHVHTSCSDGSLPPAEVVDLAIEKGFNAIAIADHDTLDGVAPARVAAEGRGLEIVPAVEFSTDTGDRDPSLPEIHLVGLFLDIEHPRLRQSLTDWRECRRNRVVEMVRRLNRCGIELREEEVFALAQGESVGRVHVAKALLKRGVVGSVGAAFQRYIGNGMPAYVPRERPPTDEIIRLIHESSGVAVLAHPGLSIKDEELPPLVEAGLDGIEVYCGEHSWMDQNHFEEMAKFYGLLVSGGSDFHGHHKRGITLGTVRLEEEYVEQLRERAGEHAKGRAHG